MLSLKLGTGVAGAGVLALVGWLAGCGGGGGGTGAGSGGAGGGAGVGTGGHLGTGGQTTTGGHPGTGGSATGGTSGLGGSGLGGSNASGGTSGACTGTPTSACSASDCDLFPGCSATSGGCTGTPMPCSASDGQAGPCAAELGCGIPSDAGICTNFYSSCNEIGNDLNLCNSVTGCHYDQGNCVGTIIDCETITSETSCSGMSACNWTPAKSTYCEGSATACKNVPRSACAAQAGCQVAAAVCTGTPTPCASLTGAACASQPGCVWSGGPAGTGGTGGTTPVKLPDLVVSQLVAEEAQNQGQDTFHFGLTETNRGVVDAAPHSVQVVLSPDNVIGDQNDVPLWTLTVTGPMSPFGIGSAVWAPAYYAMTELVAAVPAGYYYPGVVLDSKNEVTESEETNNTAVGSRMFIGTPSYDLAAVAVSSGATAALAPGDALAVSVTVQNKSNVDVSSIPISLLLSSDGGIDANDLRFCTTTSTTTLGTGAQAVIPVSCTVPRLRGAYHLGAVLDPANVLAETDETNNGVIAAGTLTIAAPSPDLTASGAATDLTDVPFSGNVTFSADAHNVGVDAAGPFNVGFYLSLTPTLAANTPLVCQVAVPAGLAAGAQTHVSESCAIPAMDSGAWYVIAKADDRDDVFETDETNNISVAPATITVAEPTWDLGGTFDDNGGQNLSVGQNITFMLTVANTGPDTIPGFDASVMLSTDMSIGGSDHLLCTVTLGAVPGQSEAGFTFSCNIPSVAAGSYYTGVVLDPQNALTETDETNNIMVDAVPRPIAN